jgi:hypothetical protein
MALLMVLSPVQFRGVAAGLLGGAIGSLFATIAGTGMSLALVISAGLGAGRHSLWLVRPLKEGSRGGRPRRHAGRGCAGGTAQI